MDFTISAQVINGKPLLDPQTRQKTNDFYRAREGKTVYIYVSEKRLPRSVVQNNYYWKCLGIVADETGDTAEYWHGFFKNELLPRYFDDQGNEVEKSTTRLSTKEFTKYMEGVIRICAEYNIVLPEPEHGG